ncbi:MAG: Crp/Fnr family transcriptional regulator [Roseibium sp.]|uniref:Crp/Fnr family transcriptional regulator n=1 Tax=Roseibium sp. TaxID=1936156 RepID=UPI0026243363|nr:Crp/Fnr family transcriptional regulator [Roseibium sp.]MCV0428546.1 Crp/Fnr family transcriptional regulator [Roseibium sp.]
MFRKHYTLENLAKNQTLLLQGETSRHAYFVESGCLRLWYNNDGEDISVKFFLAGDTVASLDSFYLNTPSKFGLESVAPSKVRVASRKDLQAKMEASSDFTSKMLTVAVHCMSDYQDLFVNRIAASPEDRYKMLLNRDPKLFDIVSQRHIASYLGITPVSLSRIRRKLKRI